MCEAVPRPGTGPERRNYMPGSLYYGDNLTVLREHVRDESVDLVYLDPPFNSNAT
jgi:16S rRNA G966 N2-methylase RsmD